MALPQPKLHWANHMFWGVTAREAAKGLWGKQAEIAAGTLLYRFIDLNDGWVHNAADGAWWFEQKQFEAIQGFGYQHGFNLAHCVRMLASVHGEYDEVNALVWAEVHPGRLLVWKGTAKPAKGEATEFGESAFGERLRSSEDMPPDSPAGGNRPLSVSQVYIPGLGRPYRKFKSYMRLLGAARLDADWPPPRRAR